MSQVSEGDAKILLTKLGAESRRFFEDLGSVLITATHRMARPQRCDIRARALFAASVGTTQESVTGFGCGPVRHP